MDNIMSIVERTPEWVWQLISVYLVVVVLVTTLRWYIAGSGGASYALVLAFLPLTLPYITIETVVRRTIRKVKIARGKRLLNELGIIQPFNYFNSIVAEDKLRYYAKRFQNESDLQTAAFQSGNEEQILNAAERVKIAKSEFWKAHEAYTLLGLNLHKKFSDYT